MPNSRFWRITGTICSILSGIYIIFQALRVIKARFSSGNPQTAPEERARSIVITGLGARFIAPTPINLHDIEEVINRTPALLSHFPRLFPKRPATEGQHESPSTARAGGIPALAVDIEPAIPALEPQTAVPIARASKPKPGRRALVLVASLLLAALIATNLLFSVHLFSASLGQSADAQANAAQPQLAGPAYERGIIYPQWYNDGYGVNDTTWQQSVAT